jgi:hypothetical protein
MLQLTPIRTGKHNTLFWGTDQGRCVLRIAPPDDAGFLFYERRMMRQESALHMLIRAHHDSNRRGDRRRLQPLRDRP